MGAIILGLAFYLNKNAFFENPPNDQVKKIGDAAFYVMVIFGSAGIAIGLLGLATSKWPKCFCLGIVSY